MDELTRLAHEARRAVPGSLDAFIRASHDPVWRLCEALVDAQTADDLTQETFVKAVRAIRRFRGDASARTWILSIARYTCMDELRARNRDRRRSAAERPIVTEGGATGRAAHTSRPGRFRPVAGVVFPPLRHAALGSR